MRRPTRTEGWLLAAGVAFILLALVPIAFGETQRELDSACVNCGVTQYHVYRVLTVAGAAVRLPIGTATSGGARLNCAHEMRRMPGGPGDLLRRR